MLADNAEPERGSVTLDGLRSARQYEDFVTVIEEMVTDRRPPARGRRDSDARRAAGQHLSAAAACRGRCSPSLLGYAKNWARMRVLDTHAPGQRHRAAVSGRVAFRRSCGGAITTTMQDHPLKREDTSPTSGGELRHQPRRRAPSSRG